MNLNSVAKIWTTVGQLWRQPRSLWHVDRSDQHGQPVIIERSGRVSNSSHNDDKEEIEHNQGADGRKYNESYLGLIVIPGRFPPEIWCLIIVHAASTTGVNFEDSSGYNSNKLPTNWLLNLASTSKFHRQLVLSYWARTVHLLKQVDVEELEALGAANGINLLRCVRRLVCATAYQVYRAPRNAFGGFEFIEELILNCHLDINFAGDILGRQQNPHVHAGPQVTHEQGNHLGVDAQGDLDDNDHPHHDIPQPIRMSYRRLRVKFPYTLRTLRVYDSHVPDIYFIQQVAEQCPFLQSLTLARCTIFSRHECDFWKHLPRTESDAYFSNRGIPTYATAIGKELKQINRLAELNIGIYLTNHAAIDIHLEQHVSQEHQSGPGMRVWEKLCEKCATQYQEATITAEREATETLAKEVPTLLTISWASFFSEKRTGWSTHHIMRDEGGNFQGLSSAADGLTKC